MRKPLILPLLLATISLFSACKKTDSGAFYPERKNLPVPMYGDSTFSLFPTSYLVLLGPSIPDVDGLLMTNNIVLHLSDSTGNSIGSFSRSWAMALFWDSTRYDNINYWTNAWNISLNNVNLPWDTAQLSLKGLYQYQDANNTWNWNGNNQWSISGNNMTPSASQSVNGNMPQFMGVVPDTLPATGNISFTFDNTNTLNADSAYFFIYDNNDPVGSSVISRTSPVVSTNGGTASISFTNTSALTNGRYFIHGQYYPGALFMIVLYQHEIHTFNGKQIAFVKQRQILKNVMIR